MHPNGPKGWLTFLYPLAKEGGAVLSLALLAALIVSLWWMTGIVRECITRNRAMTEQIIAIQDRHHAELMRYVHCPPVQPPR